MCVGVLARDGRSVLPPSSASCTGAPSARRKLCSVMLLPCCCCWLSVGCPLRRGKFSNSRRKPLGAISKNVEARMVRGWRVWACRVLKAWFSLKHSVKPSNGLIWVPFCLVAALTGANRMRRSNVRNRAACWHRPGFPREFPRVFPRRFLFALSHWRMIRVGLEWSDKMETKWDQMGPNAGKISKGCSSPACQEN